jgi:hypothetical protein
MPHYMLCPQKKKNSSRTFRIRDTLIVKYVSKYSTLLYRIKKTIKMSKFLLLEHVLCSYEQFCG